MKTLSAEVKPVRVFRPTNLRAAMAWVAGGTQNFGQTSQLNASAANAVTGGTQAFRFMRFIVGILPLFFCAIVVGLADFFMGWRGAATALVLGVILVFHCLNGGEGEDDTF